VQKAAQKPPVRYAGVLGVMFCGNKYLASLKVNFYQ
jgi:hypothetical protein